VADFVSILTNLNESLSSVEKLITSAAYVFGIFMIIKGIYHLREFDHSRSNHSGSASGYSSLIYILVGLCLLYLPTALSLFNNTIFGYDTPLAYSSLSDFLMAQYGNVTTVMIRLVQIAGVLWFLLGLSMIAKATSPGAEMGGRGIAYIFGGILAFNVQGTANMLAATAQMVTTGQYSLGLASFFSGQ